jgi:hypothetical protein
VQVVPIEINLIPPRILEISKRKEQGLYWALTFVAIYLIMASTIPVTAQKDEAVQQEIKALKQVLGRYDPALINNPAGRSSYETDLDVIKNEVTQFQSEVRVLDNLRNAQHFWLEQIEWLTNAKRKGIALSSVQTVLIGKPKNTGQAARDTQNGVETVQTVSASTPKPKQASSGRFGSLSGSLVTSSILGSGDVVGFPGISASESGRVVEPNGIGITGYGADILTVQEFVKNLEDIEELVKDDTDFQGVYFHIKELELVSESELTSADAGKLKSVPSGSSGQAASRGDDDGGGLGGKLDFGGISISASGDSNENSDVKIVKFQIEIQFLGKPIIFTQ